MRALAGWAALLVSIFVIGIVNRFESVFSVIVPTAKLSAPSDANIININNNAAEISGSCINISCARDTKPYLAYIKSCSAGWYISSRNFVYAVNHLDWRKLVKLVDVSLTFYNPGVRCSDICDGVSHSKIINPISPKSFNSDLPNYKFWPMSGDKCLFCESYLLFSGLPELLRGVPEVISENCYGEGESIPRLAERLAEPVPQPRNRSRYPQVISVVLGIAAFLTGHRLRKRPKGWLTRWSANTLVVIGFAILWAVILSLARGG